MKRLFFLTVCIFGLTLSAQEHPFSATLSYPLPIGDNFLSEYTGVADFGVRYRFVDDKAVNFGLGFNANYLTENVTLSGVNFKDRFWLVQPKVIAELHVGSLDKFVPFLGAGYTLAGFKTTVDDGQSPDRSDSFGGVNINLGGSYDFSDNWFVQLQYDYVRLNRDVLGDKSYANNIALLKLGVGYRF